MKDKISSRSDLPQVISGFPGIGKSALSRNPNFADLKITDLESSQFTWKVDQDGSFLRDENGDRIFNPKVTQDYKAAVLECLKTQDLVLINRRPEIIKALVRERVRLMLVYPARDLLEEYIDRIRGSDRIAGVNKGPEYESKVRQNWDHSIRELENFPDTDLLTKKVLKKGEYLSDLIPTIFRT